MAEEPNDQQEQETSEERYARIPRDQIRRLEEKAKRSDQLERQVALLTAGVDLTTPLGKLFAKGYEGELEVDAIRTAATEVGAIKVTTEETTVDSTKPPETELEDGETRSTEERQATASGAEVEEKRGEHPSSAARKEADRVMAEGGKKEDAIAAAFGVKLAAAQAGDDRAVWNP